MISPIAASLKTEVEILRKGKLCKPRMAIITPTYKCNQNCYYCFFKEKNNGDQIELSKLADILKQIRDYGVQSIEYCGGGEALTLKGIEKMFEYAHKIGLKQGLLTNGVLFSGAIARTFLKYGSYVRFSLDTIDRTKYKKIRGTDDCEKVLKNIDNAVLLKQKNDYMCEISIKIGYAKEIEMHDIQAIFDFAHNKRIYSIQLKNLWNEQGEYYNVNLQKEDVYRTIKTHGTKFTKKVGSKKRMREQCWISPVQVTIDCYGNVYLCCYFQYRDKAHKIGNIFETSFAKLWGSPQHLKALKSTKIEDCEKHDCRFIRYQEMIRHQERSGDWYFV